jgi:phage gpG-like protein
VSTTLKEYAERLSRLGEPGALDGMKREIAVEGLKLIEAGFRAESDPYGQKWATRKREYPWAILTKSGEFRRSFFGYPLTNGVRFVGTAPYGIYHQTGTQNMASRKTLPVSARGLGMRWTKMVDGVFARGIKKALRP